VVRQWEKYSNILKNVGIKRERVQRIYVVLLVNRCGRKWFAGLHANGAGVDLKGA
jgi:hypothetical protein